MSRTRAKITQADVARALRAVRDSGVKAAVEIKPDGTILIRTDLEPAEQPAAVPATGEPEREWRL